MCRHWRHPLSSKKPSQCTPKKKKCECHRLGELQEGGWGLGMATPYPACCTQGDGDSTGGKGGNSPFLTSCLDFWLSCHVCRGLLWSGEGRKEMDRSRGRSHVGAGTPARNPGAILAAGDKPRWKQPK